MISWSNLGKYFDDLLPDNLVALITPSRVRTALSALMQAFESAVQFAVTTPEMKSITVFREEDRSWQISLSSAANTIGFFAFTTVSKKILILNKDFLIAGTGTKRTFQISNATIDDFYPGEEIVYTENVRGALIEFKVPQFAIRQVNGVNQYGWNYPEAPAEEFQSIGPVGAPMFSPAKAFPLAVLTKTTILTHEFNSTSIDVRIKNSRGGELSFVSGYPVSKSQIAFDMEDGAGFSDVTVFLYVFPD